MNRFPFKWVNPSTQEGIRYTCGYCGTDTTPSKGWYTESTVATKGYVLICTNCNKPSFIVAKFKDGEVLSTTPTAMMGKEVNGLPEDVAALYDEARRCTGTKSFTSAVLTCRKILMHVAVEKGAPQGKHFIEYVEYLSNKNYIPPESKGWVDHIRSKSNEANHEIKIMEQSEAEELLDFTEMLIRVVYEFPHRIKIKKDKNKKDENE